MCVFDTSTDIIWLQLCGFISGYSDLVHLVQSVFVPVPLWLCHCGAVVQFEVRHYNAYSIVLSA